MKESNVALAPFLLQCPSVTTLGIRPTIDDYTDEGKFALRHARRIFFPTPRFAELFRALQKPTFPAPTTYRYQQSRILQHTLFQYLRCPHPHSRIYFGRRQKQTISSRFEFPFLALGPRVLPGTVHSVMNTDTLQHCIARYNPLIIQEAVSWAQRLRLICVQFECLGALRHTGIPSGSSAWEPIPLDHNGLEGLLYITRQLLRLAHLDDILIEWGYGKGKWQLIGMKRPPVLWETPHGRENRHHHICRLIQEGRL